MSNPFEAAGHDLKVAAEHVLHVAEDIASVGVKVIKAIEDVKALTPTFKAELSTLIDDAEAIATPLAPVLASSGTNVALDAAALEPVVTEVIKLVKDFVAFVPTVTAALKQIGEDITPATTVSAA